jgi:hypothetical protein
MTNAEDVSGELKRRFRELDAGADKPSTQGACHGAPPWGSGTSFSAPSEEFSWLRADDPQATAGCNRARASR